MHLSSCSTDVIGPEALWQSFLKASHLVPMPMALVSGLFWCMGRISFPLVSVVGTKVSFITLRVAWWNEATQLWSYPPGEFFFAPDETEGIRKYPMAELRGFFVV